MARHLERDSKSHLRLVERSDILNVSFLFLRLFLKCSALRVEQSKNDLCKEGRSMLARILLWNLFSHETAMTCAQSHCRSIELQNAQLRGSVIILTNHSVIALHLRRIDAVKSRIESIQLQPYHEDLVPSFRKSDLSYIILPVPAAYGDGPTSYWCNWGIVQEGSAEVS